MLHPIEVPVRDLFRRLTVIDGLLFNLKHQLDTFRKEFEQSLEQSSFELSDIWSGKALVVRDLSELEGEPFSIGAFISQGEEYFKLVDTLVSKQSAWAVSQAFEAFETFLIDVIVTYLMEYKNLVDGKKLEKFTSEKQVSLKEYAEWREFVKFSYRNNKDRLKYLRKLARQLGNVESKNYHNLDFKDWYLVVSDVRQAVTHSNSVIKKGKMGSWARQKRSIRDHYFPGVEVDSGYKLRLHQKDAEINLELFAEYGLVIFKLLSEQHGYDWKEVLRPKHL